MALTDEQIQRLLAPKPKKAAKPKAQAAPAYSDTWLRHFHHKPKNEYRARQIGSLSYDLDLEQECSLLGCGHPTFYEVDGKPKCCFHALADLAHQLKDGDGNNGSSEEGTNGASPTDYF